MAQVSLQHVHKAYEKEEQAITDFSLTISDKEFMVIVGPSGCGKSTILRIIAGLEPITSGDVYIDEQLVTHLPAKDRDISFVFQQFSLYPHMSVYENLAFGLKRRKWHKNEINKQIKHAAHTLELTDYLKRKPASLSGGQKQRVALGRALVRKPKLFLMDEPLSSLDAKLRTDMRTEIKTIHEKLGTTTIYVTHDQIEALSMADKVTVVKDGMIQQVGTPQEVYHNPNNMFVAGFLGSPPMNFIRGRVKTGHFRVQAYSIPLPEKIVKSFESLGYSDKDVILGIRPEHILTDEKSLQHSSFKMSLPITKREMHGADFLLSSDLEGQRITFRSTEPFSRYESVNIAWKEDYLHFFEETTGKSII